MNSRQAVTGACHPVVPVIAIVALVIRRRDLIPRCAGSYTVVYTWGECNSIITGDHSKLDKLLLVKIGKYMFFFVCTVGLIYCGFP